MQLRRKRRNRIAQSSIESDPRKTASKKELSTFDFPGVTQGKRNFESNDDLIPKRRRRNTRERKRMKSDAPTKPADVFDFPLSHLTKVREAEKTEKLKEALGTSQKRKFSPGVEPPRVKRRKPNEPRNTRRKIDWSNSSLFNPPKKTKPAIVHSKLIHEFPKHPIQCKRSPRLQAKAEAKKKDVELARKRSPRLKAKALKHENKEEKVEPKRSSRLREKARKKSALAMKASTAPGSSTKKAKSKSVLKKSEEKKVKTASVKKVTASVKKVKPLDMNEKEVHRKTSLAKKNISSISIKAPPLKKVKSLEDVFCSQPVLRLKSGPPKLNRAKTDSAIAEMRKKNLAKKSNSALLLDFLVQRDSEALEEARKAAIGEDYQYTIPFDEERPDIDGKNTIGRITRNDVKVVSYLLSQGANPDVMDEDGLFPLVVAMHYTRCGEVVKLLIEKDADVTYEFSYRGSEPQTLVDLAITFKLADVAKSLLQKGALPSKRYVENFNRNLWDFAVQHDFIRQVEALFEDRLWAEIESNAPDLHVIEAMCAHGLDPDEAHKQGNRATPLYFVVKNLTDPELVRILLEAGSSPDQTDETETPMICYPILRSGAMMFEILCLLLQFDANLSVKVDGVPLLEFAELHSSDSRCLERIKYKNEQKNLKPSEQSKSKDSES